MEAYAGLVPEALEALTAEGATESTKMLRLQVLVHPDTSLGVSGALVGGVELGDAGLLRIRESRNTQPSEVRFRVLLKESPRIELALV